MANKQTIETQVKFSADIEQLTKAVNQIQAKMNDLKPAGNFGNNMRSILTDLQTEIERFTAKSQRNLSSMADARALETSGNKINDLFNRLTNQLESLSTKSNKELKKIFPENLPENVKAAISELEEYINQENERKKAIDENTKAIAAQ